MLPRGRDEVGEAHDVAGGVPVELADLVGVDDDGAENVPVHVQLELVCRVVPDADRPSSAVPVERQLPLAHMAASAYPVEVP